MPSYASYFQTISLVLPPLIAFLAAFFQREFRFRDLRSSSYSRKRILNTVASYSKDFYYFFSSLRTGEDPGYFDFLSILPGAVVFVTFLILVVKQVILTSYIFYIMGLSLILLLIPIGFLGYHLKPKFLKFEHVNLNGEQVQDRKDSFYEEKKWKMDKRTSFLYESIFGLYGIPYSMSIIVFLYTIWILLTYLITRNNFFSNELTSYGIVSISILIVLMVYRTQFVNFMADIENRAFLAFQQQINHPIEPEVRIFLGLPKGGILEIRGMLKGIGRTCKIEDSDGFSHVIEWKDISSIGIKKE